ncbi:sulfite exporter TauE/SafE family protein [Geodermatophilus sp. DSM 44513]|uniref:sulfite exporter TauE/SafE family protein n=1 Tax=Geodermatophilus sp. DSM 44513 TaxID=1528104 RepID=UPI0012820869|nr:sulfite exporter TauE/SafE family protein [Geodermatophilus sp. DSM 44513]WNV76688.1 sulfite exporter TauE/SafE family protein [Geodermatophilus sp. DSM 44513]
MPVFVLFALVSGGAQLVDGSLGMGYGVTTTSILLALGTSPVAASATVQFAEVGTAVATGLSHWRFGNVDWRVVVKIGVPGGVGAFAGAQVLSSIPADVARPLMAAVLVALGVYLLARFTLHGVDRRNLGKPMRSSFLAPLGLGAGFVNAIGGGGWGPISTPAILSSGRMEPRRAVGSVDTSKFLVALSASAGFLSGLGADGVDPVAVAGLLVGGVLAAPVAAWLVRRIAPRLLGSLVGGALVLFNVRVLLGAEGLDVPGPVRGGVLLAVAAVWALAVTHSVREYRRDRVRESADALAAEAARLRGAGDRAVAAGRPADPRH